MSKKEQKLKKNLYKALTEYFIHNVKNSLSSSENILDQLASFRMETRLPAALRQDKKYQKAQKNCNKANEKMQDPSCRIFSIHTFFPLYSFFRSHYVRFQLTATIL
ncbi:hypothetical protein [Anaerobutyricum hallii]|uniref:hypothetical protein n=1 Tax=Anaerobutyricum hallii TaxID=39488 RepID=UPI0039A2F856